jgi:hypothetical protein
LKTAFRLSCSAISPQIPKGVLVFRPLKATTVTAPRSPGLKKSAMTCLRYFGYFARSPRAMRLCVFPPPIDWLSRNVPEALVVLPSSRLNASVRRMRMPSVT